MLYDEIINHMTEDELRNYVHHQTEVLEASDQLSLACHELADNWKHVVQALEYHQDCWKKRSNRLSTLRNVEKDLEQKYQEFIPKPILYCDDNKVS